MESRFKDVGNGWFLVIEDDGQQHLADSHGTNPDRGYGPMAWSQGNGPITGETLVNLESTEKLKYDYQVECYMYGEGDAPDPCTHWPAFLHVTKAGKNAGISVIEHKAYTETEFLNIITACQENPELKMLTSAREERLELAKKMHKQYGG